MKIREFHKCVDDLLPTVGLAVLSSGCWAVKSRDRVNTATSLIELGKLYIALNHSNQCCIVSQNKLSSLGFGDIKSAL